MAHPCGHLGCRYVAVSRSKLDAHARTHSGERPFACAVDGCGYAAAQKSKLIRHTSRIHHDNPPRLFPCTIAGCTHSAADKSDLEKHENTHRGSQLFACAVAGCAFTSTARAWLARHSQTHALAQPPPRVDSGTQAGEGRCGKAGRGAAVAVAGVGSSGRGGSAEAGQRTAAGEGVASARRSSGGGSPLQPRQQSSPDKLFWLGMAVGPPSPLDRSPGKQSPVLVAATAAGHRKVARKP